MALLNAAILQDEKVAARKEAEAKAEAELQKIYDAINVAEIAREKAKAKMKLDIEQEKVAIAEKKQATYAETVASVFNSISPDLAAALTAKANAQTLIEVSKAVSPYAMARGDESVADVTNKLLRGTSLEMVIDQISDASK